MKIPDDQSNDRHRILHLTDDNSCLGVFPTYNLSNPKYSSSVHFTIVFCFFYRK